MKFRNIEIVGIFCSYDLRMSVSMGPSLLISFEDISLAHKWWKEFCFAFWLFCILFETAIRYDQSYTVTNHCAHIAIKMQTGSGIGQYDTQF
jgi:hypothetical protein